MPKSVFQQLEDMCIEIFAHSDNDWEITISGNAINACEAKAVAWGILDILHGNGRKWEDQNQAKIRARAVKLRK